MRHSLILHLFLQFYHNGKNYFVFNLEQIFILFSDPYVLIVFIVFNISIIFNVFIGMLYA